MKRPEPHSPPPHPIVPSRRDFLGQATGALAAGLLSPAGLSARSTPLLSIQYRSVIFLFMDGGPSHLDLFDPKPELNRLHGQPLPPSFGPVLTPMGTARNTLLGSPWRFRKHGQSGIEVSDLLPHLARCVDDLALLRSCHADGLNHVASVCQMNTGSLRAGRPSLGARVLAARGSANDNLPGFVVMSDAGIPTGGARNWGTAFLPPHHGGCFLRDGTHPDSSSDTSAALTEATDVNRESQRTQAEYGLDRPECHNFAHRCLLARRLVERGVRFVQIYCGGGGQWDAHTDLATNHARMAARCDRPTAALLHDLKRRGLLKETLVIWGGEFGRAPMNEGGTGRDHNPYGFTMWLAGGGVTGGQVIGRTDDLGLRALDPRISIHDLHATVEKGDASIFCTRKIDTSLYRCSFRANWRCR